MITATTTFYQRTYIHRGATQAKIEEMVLVIAQVSVTHIFIEEKYV